MALPAEVTNKSVADPIKISGFPAQSSAPTVGSCFGEFLRRIVPSHTAYSLARGACEDAIKTLRTELRPAAAKRDGETAGDQPDHFIVGSVGKRTSVAPIGEVDVLYLLPEKLKAQKSGDALKVVWAVLKNKFDGTKIGETSVVLRRGEHWVNVIPGRDHNGAFLIPGRPTVQRSSGWTITNPVAEAATLRLSDSLYGGRPRLLLTVLKAWRDHSGVPISSYALELLSQEFYSGAPRPYDLERAVVEFWAWARKRTPCALKPPGGQSAVEVGTHWHQKAKAAYWRTTLAEHHVSTGKIVDAALEWRQLLGPIFPVPGEGAPLAPPIFKEANR